MSRCTTSPAPTDCRALLAAIRRGEQFLGRRQESDGMWRDYDLAPGPSEAWTTACAAFCLSTPPIHSGSPRRLSRAADALHAIRRPLGWGYNRNTSEDADTTSWCLRFLAAIDDLRDLRGESLLSAFLTEHGEARTFPNARFGRWSEAHPDVTPVLALAMLAVHGANRLISLLQEAVQRAQLRSAEWDCYWWTTKWYSTARNLEFLTATGGLTATQRIAVDQRLSGTSPDSAFEAAAIVDASVSASLDRKDISFASGRLAEMQNEDGSWPASSVLRIPPQQGDGRVEIAADSTRVLGTSFAIRALKRSLSLQFLSTRRYSRKFPTSK